jgi:hypothetical protein
MSRQPPEEPTTTVLVVIAYELVATSTPDAISVKLRTEPVYHSVHRPGSE